MSVIPGGELLDPKQWTAEDEVHLLFSVLDHKPVGIDKHLQMSVAWKRFVSSSKKTVTSDVLWKKLASWYNIEHLDSIEPLPFDNKEEDFLLPAEIVPEHYYKNLSEEEKKNLDSSGTMKKYISVSELDDDDPESKSKLKGSEKMKWFESPQYLNKTVDKISKKSESESKLYVNESSNDSSTETHRVIRQYGKAGKVSSGSIMTVSVSAAVDELYDNVEEDSSKEELQDSKNDGDQAKLKRKRPHKRGESSEESESPIPTKQPSKGSKITESPTSNTRSRKASIASHEASSGTETESLANEDISRNMRRHSQRVSDGKPEIKRTKLSRR